jgi:Arc/MetJ family transcription regulator
MKTTIDVTDALLDEAKQVAAREGTTVRALVEAGLRHVLAERKAPMAPYRLRRASFGGRGLQPEMAGQGWDRLREIAYEGRGA